MAVGRGGPDGGGAGADALVTAARDALRGSVRARPEAGWSGVRGAVLRTVRTAQRASSPVLAEPLAGTGGEPDGVLLVSEQVLRVLAGRAVSDGLPCVVTDLRTELVGTELRAVRLRLRVAYGTPLHPLAAQARGVVLQVLAEVLGPRRSAELAPAVVVEVDDVTAADPRSV